MMLNEIVKVGQFMMEAFLHAWPYLLITIPLAVIVNVSGISKYIEKALRAKPILAIFLATLVGAFSPFCSCGVIPVISALLISGVPLAPVMSFWLASPSMDPEIFFLSVSELGSSLAVWRLAGTFGMSLAGGLITHLLIRIKWLDSGVLKIQKNATAPAVKTRLIPAADSGNLNSFIPPGKPGLLQFESYTAKSAAITGGSCSTDSCGSSCGAPGFAEGMPPLVRQILKESRSAVLMITKFMTLAFFLEALIILYVPEEWIIQVLGQGNRMSIALSALIGIPLYTTNLTALGLMAGFLNRGMQPGAVLAFLISGATTTIPAMAAVYGLVKLRVFLLYVGYTLGSALIAGYFYQIIVSA